MAVSLFPKCYKHAGILSKLGSQKNRFVCIVLPIVLPIVMPIVLPVVLLIAYCIAYWHGLLYCLLTQVVNGDTVNWI